MGKQRSVFEEYDIRGVAGKELTAGLAYKIGRAVAVFLKSSRLLVGRDCRLSSPALHEAFVRGVRMQGVTVVDLDLCSTPMLYFASKSGPAVMITASHLPKQFNGIKIVKQHAVAVNYKTGLSVIERIVQKNCFPKKLMGGIGHVHVLADYARFVQSFAHHLRQLKVVVDAGNGMAGFTSPAVFKNLPVNVVPLFWELDGRYPNRDPNPHIEGALEKLQKKVVQVKADMGVGYDSDCDRVFFVDEQGKLLPADDVLCLLARDRLRVHKRATVLFTPNMSNVVSETIRKFGGKAVMTKVGHSNIKQSMRKYHGVLAGEDTGHFYFRENQFADSGDIAAMLMLSLLSHSNKPLSVLCKQFHKYVQSGEINFTILPGAGKKLLRKVRTYFSEQAKKVITLDGISMYFGDWWFSLRESKTEPFVRLNVEANTTARCRQKTNEVRSIIVGK